MSGRTSRTDRAKVKKERFLEVLRATCNVSEACREARLARRTAYEWRDADPDFGAAWLDAEEEAADALEREAWRRGVEGTERPIIYQGKVTGVYREYSDRMLELLLKAHRPQKYADRLRAEHSGRGGAPITHQAMKPITQEDLDAMTPEEANEVLAKALSTPNSLGRSRY